MLRDKFNEEIAQKKAKYTFVEKIRILHCLAVNPTSRRFLCLE
ncbi:MAG: hypothetical protein ACI808_003413 [Paraglaciecola sp.]|jgi:hypothetical protein